MQVDWKEKNLEELENNVWPEPEFADDLTQKLHALRQTPLNRLRTEDIRLLIGQGASLTFLVPLAIEKLQNNPFVEGDFYPGDLLQSVLNVDSQFWLENRSFWQTLYQLVLRQQYELEDRGIQAEQFLELS